MPTDRNSNGGPVPEIDVDTLRAVNRQVRIYICFIHAGSMVCDAYGDVA